MRLSPCFKCGKELEPVLPGREPDELHQPYAGTRFISYGHYGSTVFDPHVWDDASSFLEVNICDECLLRHKENVLYGREHRGPVSYDYDTWQPEMDLDVWQQWQEKAALRRAEALRRYSPTVEAPDSSPGQCEFDSR